MGILLLASDNNIDFEKPFPRKNKFSNTRDSFVVNV